MDVVFVDGKIAADWLESYDGVNKVEVFITTSLVHYQDWLKREIDKKIRQSSSVAVTKNE